MYRLIVILLIALLVVGCGVQGTVIITATPMATPDKPLETIWPTNTPVPEDYTPECAGLPGDGFEIINDNPCLLDPQAAKEAGTNVWINGVPQFVPVGYSLYSVPINADMEPDDYSRHLPMVVDYDESNIKYRIPIVAVNGRIGLRVDDLPVLADCYSVKIAGTAWIYDTDPGHYGDYAVLVIVNGIEIPYQLLIDVSNDFVTYVNFDKLFSFRVTAPQTIDVSAIVWVRFASGGEGSYIDLDSVSIASAPGEYCLGNVPEF